MSFGESVFSAGFNQKTAKEDLFVKGNHVNPRRYLCGKTLEDKSLKHATRLVGHPEKEGSYYVSVGDVRELIALPGEALDVPMKGFIGLLAAVLEVPRVPRALVCALEVSHEDLP